MQTLIKTVAIIEENNKFLIVQPNKDEPWEFPGGILTSGENPEEGLVRNIKELLSIDITLLDIFKVVSYNIKDKKIITLAYLAVRSFGKPKTKDYANSMWASLNMLRSGEFTFSELDKKLINKISIFSGCGPSLIL